MDRRSHESKLPHARGVAAVLAVVGLVVVPLVLTASTPPSPPATPATSATGVAADRVGATGSRTSRGAAIYEFSCSTCHGPKGLGFDDAVAAFPESHRDCSRCHHPSNAPQMPGAQVGMSVMAFSLGDPPPLADGDRIARFGTVGALHAYVATTMPRWAPGSLDDEAYLDVTAYLLYLAGLSDTDETLTPARFDDTLPLSRD